MDEEELEPFKQYVAIKFEPHRFKQEPLMEYYCPETGDSNETEYCEGMALNAGCRHLKTCPEYIKQKEFQQKYPTANWHLCFKKERQGFKELYFKLKMIKEGTIIIKDAGAGI